MVSAGDAVVGRGRVEVVRRGRAGVLDVAGVVARHHHQLVLDTCWIHLYHKLYTDARSARRSSKMAVRLLIVSFSEKQRE